MLGCFLLYAIALVAATQTSPAPASPAKPLTGTGVVLGRVIDMGSGQPVGGAIVTIGATQMMVNVMQFGGGPTISTSIPMAIDGSSKASTLRVLTDNEGRFAFLDLPKGSFQFGVSATGYVGGGYGQRRATGAPQALELADGQRMGDVTLPLWKYAAVGGTVTDEAGEPVVGMPIEVLQRRVVAGTRRFTGAASGTTDDRGVYRIGLLVPGDYVVAVAVTQASAPLALIEERQRAATSSQSGQVLSSIGAPQSPPGSSTTQQVGSTALRIALGAVPPAAPPSGRIWAYQTVFYPAARTVSEATVISIAAGEERGGVDLQLRLGAATRVSGTVSGPDGPVGGLALRLVPAGLDDLSSEGGWEAGATISDVGGSFTFLGVGPGQFVVRASRVPPTPVGQAATTTVVIDGPDGRSTTTTSTRASGPPPTDPILFANLPVAVGDADVTSLAVPLRAGAVVTGRLEFDGAAERPSPDTFKAIGVSVVTADARTPPALRSTPMGGQFDASGQVTTSGLPPGRYLLRGTGAPKGWTFKAAMYNGRDVSDTPLEVEGSDVGGVVFVFTDRTTELSGTVQDGAGAVVSVLLFPADDRTWVDNGSNPRRMKTARTTKTGAYTFTAVPAGEYFIVAVRDEAAGDWPDPAFLASLRAIATRVTLADGDKRIQNLRTVR